MENIPHIDELDSDMKKQDKLAFGCLLILPLPFLLGWFLDIMSEVSRGGAPTWKIVVLISGFVVYGLLGGLGKAFEAGFSRKHLSVGEEIEENSTEEGFSLFTGILVFVVLGGLFVVSFWAVIK